jgi:single-strand DNA-binding protein
MNYLTIAGHLGADPEVRFTSSGKKVTTLRVATNSRRGDADETTWWRVTIWGEQFDKMVSFLKKGSAIIVVGELQKPKIFTDREGASQISLDVTAHHIQFSPFGKPNSGQDKPANAAAHPYIPQGSVQMGAASASPQGMPSTNFEDEIPF